MNQQSTTGFETTDDRGRTPHNRYSAGYEKVQCKWQELGLVFPLPPCLCGCKSEKIEFPPVGNSRIFKIKMANFEFFEKIFGSFCGFCRKDFMLRTSNSCESWWKNYSSINAPKWLTFCLFFTPKKLYNFCNKFARNIHRNLKLSVSNPFVKSHKMSQKKFQNFQILPFLFWKSLNFRRAGT